jgi:hypothetical protein
MQVSHTHLHRPLDWLRVGLRLIQPSITAGEGAVFRSSGQWCNRGGMLF